MSVVMAACPHCGVQLLASLVEAIKDPNRSESCPREESPAQLVGEFSAINRLAAYAFIGSLFDLPAPTRAGTGRDSSPVPRPFPVGSPPEYSSSSVRAPELARPGS